MGLPDLTNLQRYWRHHRARFLFPAAVGLGVLALAAQLQPGPVTVLRLTLAGGIALVAYVYWMWDNRVPEIPRGRVGLVLAITCDDDDHDRQVRADLIASLQTAVSADAAQTKFYLLDLPRHHAVTVQDYEAAYRMLQRARGHFMVFGTVRKRHVYGKPVHLVRLEGVVRHLPVAETVSQEISADFRATLPRRRQIPIENDAFEFEVTSEWTDVAARYVIGLAAMASGDLEYAEVLLRSVEERLRLGPVSGAPLGHVSRRLPERFVQLYEAWLDVLYRSYYVSRDLSALRAAVPVVERLLKRAPSSYSGLLLKGMMAFLLHRDLDAAKRSIGACRRIRDVAWRYSLAFLYAYEGNMREARDQYREAFAGRLSDVTLPVQCEEFIGIVLAQEPDKAQLHFCAAEINEFAKQDLAAAAREYRLFLEHPRASRFSREVEVARQRLERLQAVLTVGPSEASAME